MSITSTHSKLPIVVLISGEGTNLQAIIDAMIDGLPIDIRAVISNTSTAFGLVRAKRAKIPTHVVPHQDYSSRGSFDEALKSHIEPYKPQLVVLAGFMRRLESAFVAHYLGRMINIHPSLLPKYRGLHTHRRVLAAKDTQHGVTIHFVTDDLDGGPIICQAILKVHQNDDEARLGHRVQGLEHKIYPEVLRWFAAQRVALVQNQVLLDGKILPFTGITLSS